MLVYCPELVESDTPVLCKPSEATERLRELFNQPNPYAGLYGDEQLGAEANLPLSSIRDDLPRLMRISADAMDDLHAGIFAPTQCSLQYAPDDSAILEYVRESGDCITLPVRLGPGMPIVGVHLLPIDRSKQPRSFGDQGVVCADDVCDYDRYRGAFFIAPIPSDVTALVTCSQAAIAPSNMSDGKLAATQIATVIRQGNFEADRPIVVVGPADWARAIAVCMANELKREIQWSAPPTGHTCAQSFVESRLANMTDEECLTEIGAWFEFLLQPKAIIPGSETTPSYFGLAVGDLMASNPPELEVNGTAAKALAPKDPPYHQYLSDGAKEKGILSKGEITAAWGAYHAAEANDEKEVEKWVEEGKRQTVLADAKTKAYLRSVEELSAQREATAKAKSKVDAKPAKTAAGNPPAPINDYSVNDGRICHLAYNRDAGAIVNEPLANFSARIAAEVVRDDGTETSTVFELTGALATGEPLPTIHVPAAEYSDLKWVVEKWGARAVVDPGRTSRERLRAAIQLLSDRMPRRTVYTHTGWRQINGEWCYLNANGAIGPQGPVAGIEVDLPFALSRYILPAPATNDELQRAIKASLGILNNLGPDRVILPMYAATWRAVLGETDLSLNLAGFTGTFKSETASLIQRHFGAEMDGRHLPANWASTGNALEKLAYCAKDTLMVVDDFCPVGSSTDVARMHKDADRLLRGAGNGSGRQRMRADLTLHPDKPPRCLVLSTGEDTPKGQSLQARLLDLDVALGDINVARLTKCQRDADAGLYAMAMSGFVQWLASRYRDMKTRLPGDITEARATAYRSGQHRRTPAIVASLKIGLEWFLRFANESGALTVDDANAIKTRYDAAMEETAAQQAEKQSDSEPAKKFFRLLSAALASGRAHIAATDGRMPGTDASPLVQLSDEEEKDARVYGWRKDDVSRWMPSGTCIGWIDSDMHNVYLEADAAYATAQQLAGEQRESFAITAVTLHKRIKDAGMLATDSKERGLKVRKKILGLRRHVLHVTVTHLLDDEPKPEKPAKEFADL
jgi:hypothetical protein